MVLKTSSPASQYAVMVEQESDGTCRSVERS